MDILHGQPEGDDVRAPGRLHWAASWNVLKASPPTLLLCAFRLVRFLRIEVEVTPN